jgi:hypothetical protein
MDWQFAWWYIRPVWVVNHLARLELDNSNIFGRGERQPSFLRPAATNQQVSVIDPDADMAQDVFDQAAMSHHSTRGRDLSTGSIEIGVTHESNLLMNRTRHEFNSS